MTETALTRSAKTYELEAVNRSDSYVGEPTSVETACFVYSGGAWPSVFKLEGSQWRDMGEPEQITVTIEPGDTLNEGGPCVCGHVSLEQHAAADDALESRWKRIMGIRATVRASGGLRGAGEALTASLRELSEWSSATSPHWWCPNCETKFLGVDPETVTSCMGCGSTKGAA